MTRRAPIRPPHEVVPGWLIPGNVFAVPLPRRTR